MRNLFCVSTATADCTLNRDELRNKIEGANTLLQKASLIDRRSNLLKKLQQFRRLQAVFMPGLGPRPLPSDDTRLPPENEPLRLPSSLDVVNRAAVCLPHVADAEVRLRFADTHDALDDLRRNLRTRTWLNNFKVQNITGVNANTRARALQKSVDVRASAYARQYRRSRAAYLALTGRGDWERVLQPLKDDDIRGMNERALTQQERDERARIVRLGVPLNSEHDEGEVVGVGGVHVSGALETGEGRRAITISWIWLSSASADDASDPKMRDGKYTLSLWEILRTDSYYISFQHSEWNGQRQNLESTAGARRRSSSVKKCVAYWSTGVSWRNGGYPRRRKHHWCTLTHAGRPRQGQLTLTQHQHTSYLQN